MTKRIHFKVSEFWFAAVALEINSSTESALSDKIINLKFLFYHCVN